MNHIRLFIARISELIPNNSRVLDLGCGDGTLLDILNKKKGVKGYGVEIEINNIKSCIQKGLSVYQGNIIEALKEFNDNAFNVVVLSHTLQEIYDPVLVINEMLRVGEKAIITFPNFGHWRIRLHLLLSGNSPKSKSLPYQWHNTPNIRVITIKDFLYLCRDQNITILKQEAFYKSKLMRMIVPKFLHNLFSIKGLFVLEKN